MTTPQYAIVKRHVDQLLGFAVHTVVFVAVNGAIFTQTGFQPEDGRFWGWGIGLAAHALIILPQAARLRERMIERQLQHEPSTTRATGNPDSHPPRNRSRSLPTASWSRRRRSRPAEDGLTAK